MVSNPPITHHKKQISWVPVYFIFVQQNLVQAIPGLSHLSREALILLQLLVYIPLSLLRHIKVSGATTTTTGRRRLVRRMHAASITKLD